jgi:hypothetical protein
VNSTQHASFSCMAATLPFHTMTKAVFLCPSTNMPAPFRTLAALLPFGYMAQALVGERFLKACRNSDFYPHSARRLFLKEI